MERSEVTKSASLRGVFLCLWLDKIGKVCYTRDSSTEANKAEETKINNLIDEPAKQCRSLLGFGLLLVIKRRGRAKLAYDARLEH